MAVLSERDAEKYIATDGKICPFCGSKKLRNFSKIYYLQGSAMAQDIECLNCLKIWRNTYRLTGIMYEEFIDTEWDTQDFDFFKK